MQENVKKGKNYYTLLREEGKFLARGVGWEKEEILLFITFLSAHRIVLCRRCQLSFVISSVISDSQIQ